MDDMRNTSAPLYGKAEPATTKTTMSVREMRQLNCTPCQGQFQRCESVPLDGYRFYYP